METLTSEEWAQEQFGECEFGNALRTRRCVKTATQVVGDPAQSLPRQCGTWAATKAAYRFFARDEVTFDRVAGPHWGQTRRHRGKRVLLISDTTDINHYSHEATEGLGILGDGQGRGLQLHHSLMFDSTSRQLIGSAGAVPYYRALVKKGETRAERLRRWRESELWGHVVEQVGTPPPDCQWIHVFDRGGDNFEAICHILQTKCDWIIRASRMNRNVLTSKGEEISLNKLLKRARRLGGYELHLRSRPGAKARIARLKVSVVPVGFVKPAHRSPWVSACPIERVDMNAVLVEEAKRPGGKKPICWVLLTNLPVETFEDAWQVIDDYEQRWLIEEYHKVLKTGCGVERHALRSADRLEPLIAMLMVVGVRLLQLKLIGRNDREARAKTHVPRNWLRCIAVTRPKLEMTDLTVHDFFRELAKMGGFLARRGDGEPGWQTIWRGYTKLQTQLDALQLAGHL